MLDELHRTGAEKSGEELNTLIDNQPESTKVLGITATPRRDVDGINMAKEMAQKLGYTNREAVSGKHIAMNMSLINAARMRLVVNPKVVGTEITLKTDGSLDRLKDKIDKIEDEQDRNEKLEDYEELRKNIEKAEGIPQILQANVKKGGKYIVFLPVISNLEDEDGNVIGRKKGKEKIADYEKQLAEYFKGSDIIPKFHSMLGEYGDKENARRLEEFQNANTEATEFMLVMNKANEGLHLEKLDGMIWLRPLDENSRILYLQQLGRVIYSEDPDNPTKDEDRPVVIDLVNNTLKVRWNLETNEQDDIEMLNLIADWAEEHNGLLPNINSTGKEETVYATVLKEIQNKYKRYLENDFDGLNEKQIEEVQEIIRLGSQIDLWQIELPDRISKSGGSHKRGITNKNVGPFELTGVLRDFVELEDEVEGRDALGRSLKNALEIEQWCKERYGEKKIWERSLPSQASKDKYEKSLGDKLSKIRAKIKKYEGKAIEKIENEEDRKIVRIIRELDKEYGLGDNLKNALEIREWCKKKYRKKKIWEKNLPSRGSKDEYEKSLAMKLKHIRYVIKQYDRIPIEEIGNDEERKIVEIVRSLDEEYGIGDSLKNALEIKEWCESTYGEKKIWERSLPNTRSKDEYEKSLGQRLRTIRVKIKKYEEKQIEEIKNEEDRGIVEIIRNLDEEYGLGDSLKNALEIKEWCESTYGEKKIWERSLPSQISKDEYEKKLGKKLSNIRTKRKQYEGIPIEKIENAEDRRIVEIIRSLDEEYGLGNSLKNALEIKEWCENTYGEKKIWERSLPSQVAEDEYEKSLGNRLSSIRTKIKQYEGIPIEEIENAEDRKIVEIMRSLDGEYGLGDSLKNVLEIEEWCERTYGEKKIWERSLPSRTSKDEYEKKLGKKLSNIRTKTKQYEGIPTDEIGNEEDRRIVEIIKRLDEEFNYRKRNRTSKEIAEASISSLTDIEMSDREDAALKELVERTKEGGMNLDEQS